MVLQILHQFTNKVCAQQATRDKARNSRMNRLLFFNIETGATKQYIYRTEIAGNYIREIVAISNSQFLVLKRDSNFPLADGRQSLFFERN